MRLFAISLLIAMPICGQQTSLTKTYVVVTDRTSNNILRFETTGDFKDSFVQNPIYLPEAVVFGPDQNLYISSYATGTVERYNGATGNYVGRFAGGPGGQLRNPEGLAFGPDGNLYVVDRTQSAVLRFDGGDGSFIDQFVRTGAGGYNNAGGITFGPDGNVYVTSGTQSQNQPGSPLSPQILRFDGHTGAFKDVFVTPRSGGLEAPFSLIFGPDGNLYVSNVTTNSVLRYDGKTGAFLNAFVPANTGGLTRPTGMAFGPDGNFYVGSSFGSTIGILRFNGTTGAFIDTFIPAGRGGLAGPTDVLFYTFDSQIAPTGRDTSVAADPAGNRIVVWTDDNVVKVEPFDASGKSIALPRAVSSATDTATNPKIIATGTGSFLVTWSGKPGLSPPPSAAGQIFLLPLPRTGLPTLAPLAVSQPPATLSDVSPALARVGGGEAAVVWNRSDSSGRGTGLVGRVIDSNGSPMGSEISLSSTTVSSDEAPAIASDSDNRVVISWRRRRIDGTSTSIIAGATDGSLRSMSAAYALDDGASGTPGNPSISANSSGKAMIAWSRGASRVLLLPIGMDAMPAGGITTVNGDVNRGAASPQVGVNEAGSVGVVWQYNGLLGGTGVYGRTVDPTGAIEKADFVVSDAANNTEAFSSPAVSLDGGGTLTIASHKTVATKSAGVFTRTHAPPTQTSTCTQNATTLCLSGDRFAVSATWRTNEGATGQAQAVRLTIDTGYFTFFNASNVEVVLKVLDACGVNSKYWVFAGGLTNVNVEMTVRDTRTGTVKTYSNPINTAFQPIQDTDAFATCSATTQPIREAEALPMNALKVAAFEGRAPAQAPVCAQNSTTLCLSGDRFAVSASWRTSDGNSGQGQAVRLTADTGYFTFFNPSNVEAVVKVLNACGLNSKYWVFAGGLTNVSVVLTVRDTKTGTVRTFTNPINTAFQPVQATDAFSTCP